MSDASTASRRRSRDSQAHSSPAQKQDIPSRKSSNTTVSSRRGSNSSAVTVSDRRSMNSTNIVRPRPSTAIAKDFSKEIDFKFMNNWAIDLVPIDSKTNLPVVPLRQPTKIKRRRTGTISSRFSRNSAGTGKEISVHRPSRVETDRSYSFQRHSGISVLPVTNRHEATPRDRSPSRHSRQDDSQLSVFSTPNLSPRQSLASVAPSLASTSIIVSDESTHGWRKGLSHAKFMKRINEKKKKPGPEETSELDRIKERIMANIKVFLLYTKDAVYDGINASLLPARLGGVTGITVAAVLGSLIGIWDALQLVYDNKKMCEGLVNSCAIKTADLLNVTKMAIIDDDALFNSLAPAVNVLTERFRGVQEFLIAQGNRKFMARYLKRRRIEKTLNNQGAKLDKEIRGFFDTVSMMTYGKLGKLSKTTETQLNALKEQMKASLKTQGTIAQAVKEVKSLQYELLKLHKKSILDISSEREGSIRSEKSLVSESEARESKTKELLDECIKPKTSADSLSSSAVDQEFKQIMKSLKEQEEEVQTKERELMQCKLYASSHREIIERQKRLRTEDVLDVLEIERDSSVIARYISKVETNNRRDIRDLEDARRGEDDRSRPLQKNTSKALRDIEIKYLEAQIEFNNQILRSLNKIMGKLPAVQESPGS